MKLHQALALHKSAFSLGEGALTRAYHALQKTALLAGVSKTYAPKDVDGQQLPGEGVKLQLRVPTVLRDAVPALIRQIDLQATIDNGNQQGRANIVIDGETIASDVSVETLLFLEKKVTSIIKNVLDHLPTVDEAEDWDDAGDGLSWKTKPSEKVRTDKVPFPFVKAQATDKHPAQVEVLHRDEVVGTWTTVRFSGALKATQKAALLERANKLLDAIKVARGEANSTEVQQANIGQSVFDYLAW